jgi:hypothetical protein
LASKPATRPAAAGDLIGFLKALPDYRMRWGSRFPQWWMLLLARLLRPLGWRGAAADMPSNKSREQAHLGLPDGWCGLCMGRA